MATRFPATGASSNGQFKWLSSLLAIAVFLNSSVGYLPPTSGGYSFEGLSQQLFWLILAVSVFVAATHGYRIAIYSMVFTIAAILFKVLSLTAPSASFTVAYRLCYSAIIALGSAIMYFKWPDSHHKLLKYVILGGVPVLLVQLLGISETAHFLNTNTGFELSRIELSPTFRVPFDEFTALWGQFRPSGLFYANSISAVFAIFAIAFRLSERLTRVTLYDFFLAYTTFLLMAKIAIVFLAVSLVVKHFVSKDKDERRIVRKLAFMACVLLSVHAWLFPGVVRIALSAEMFIGSIGIRVVDFLLSMNINALPLLNASLSEYAQVQLSVNYERADESPGDYSGIGVLLLLTPLLILLWRSISKRARRTHLAREEETKKGLLILALIFTFAATPVLGTPLIAYLFGPMLVPLLRRNQP